MVKTREWPTTAEGQKLASQHLETTSELQAPKRPPNPSRFRFEQVNEVTWKLTNGEITETPGSHGQWGGYKTTKALAWVICLGPRKWLARYGTMVCGPLSLPKAKAAAAQELRTFEPSVGQMEEKVSHAPPQPDHLRASLATAKETPRRRSHKDKISRT